MSASVHNKDRELLEFALEETNDGWWEWNVEEDKFYLSPNYWKAFGYDPDTKNHLASEWQEITHPDDIPKVQKSLEKHFQSKGKIPYLEEVRFKHIDGHWITVICRGKTLEWTSDWAPVRFVGVHTDITSMKNKEEEIKLAKAELEATNAGLKSSRDFQNLIMKYNPDLIFVKDTDYKFVMANEAFMNVYPEDQRDKVIGFTTLEKYNRDEVDEFLQKDKEAFDEGYSDTYEEILFPNGDNLILYTQKIRFNDQKGKTYILGIARDVTEIKEKEKRLAQSNEELAQFAYRTSHDLKAPLVTIKGLTSFMEEDLDNGDIVEVRENIKQIHRQAHKLEKLVIDILDLAKADLMHNADEEIDLFELVEEIRGDFKDLMQKSEIEFEVSIEKDLKLCTQKIRLNQILTNLISNSIKYHDQNKEKKYLYINITTNKDKVLIVVGDNGVGISAPNQEKLFTMFSRFNTDLAEGSGLGMSIVKKSVEVIGGSISVVSDINETRFEIEIPNLVKRL